MANTITLKNDGTNSGSAPSSLTFGELAINYNVNQEKLFYKDSGGTVRNLPLSILRQ